MSRALLVLLLIATGCAASDSGREPLVVVLSFDYEDINLPRGGENLPGVLAMLEERNISATFFILGVTADKYPGNVKKIREGGHSIGLHTYYHNFPIFSREDAALIGRIYNMSTEREWSLSFKTPEAFAADLERNREAIQRALGEEVKGEMFRAPSLVVNWTERGVYYETLKRTGIKIDSSLYQDFSDPRACYVENGVVEVPLVTFESRLGDISKTMALVEKSSKQKVPFHMVMHLDRLPPARVEELGRFLDSLEEKYRVTYLRVEEVPGYWGIR